MGYQESLLICKDRETFNKLCNSLNTVKRELDDYVTVYAIGKLKKRIGLRDYFSTRCDEYLPKDTYFVWWGGERHPYQSGWYQELLALKADWPYVGRWYCVFCDYIANMKAFLGGIDTNKKGAIQENDRISIFEIPNDEIIRQEFVRAIENSTSSLNDS